MSLPTYFDILRGNLLPRFRITAKIPTGMDSAGADILPLDELLKRHHELVKPFYEFPNPPIPEYFPRGEISLLDLKALIARRILSNCEICENRCGVDRTTDKRGNCRVGERSFYASEFIHIGEEPEIVPSHTVFFAGCTFNCIFCQNWDIAHGDMASIDAGYPADDSLVDLVMKRKKAARNLNLVGGNPDQHIATCLNLIVKLAKLGYPRPIVWNSNNYMTPDAVELLTGVADVHLADFKYGTNECGRELSGVKKYWDIITRNLSTETRVAEILIRHLVLPGHVDCCTAKIVDWVGENLPDATFNLMFQYHPEYKAYGHPVIDRYLTAEERQKATDLVMNADLDLSR